MYLLLDGLEMQGAFVRIGMVAASQVPSQRTVRRWAIIDLQKTIVNTYHHRAIECFE